MLNYIIWCVAMAVLVGGSYLLGGLMKEQEIRRKRLIKENKILKERLSKVNA